MNADELWSGFALDPRLPANGGLRASDADRERVRAVLADAFADGRLDREEYDERAATLLGTRVLGALPALVSDLVPDRTPLVRPTGGADLVAATPSDLQVRAEHEWQSQRRNAILGFLGPTLICWAVWIATAFGSGGLYFPWPLIVTAATGFGALRTLTNKDRVIAEEVRRLEHKQAKALEKRARSDEEPS